MDVGSVRLILLLFGGDSSGAWKKGQKSFSSSQSDYQTFTGWSPTWWGLNSRIMTKAKRKEMKIKKKNRRKGLLELHSNHNNINYSIRTATRGSPWTKGSLQTGQDPDTAMLPPSSDFALFFINFFLSVPLCCMDRGWGRRQLRAEFYTRNPIGVICPVHVLCGTRLFTW